MSLQKLARELDETARQTSALVEAIGEALETLADPALSGEYARHEATAMIVRALQGQDRIEQRCQNMALAVRQFALLPPTPLMPCSTKSGADLCLTNCASRRCRAWRLRRRTATSNSSRSLRRSASGRPASPPLHHSARYPLNSTRARIRLQPMADGPSGECRCVAPPKSAEMKKGAAGAPVSISPCRPSLRPRGASPKPRRAGR